MARSSERRALVVLVLLLVTVVLASALSGAPRSGSLLSEAEAAAEAGGIDGTGHDTALAVDGALAAPLAPGRREAVDVRIDNDHDEDLRLIGLVLDVREVRAPDATESRPCDLADFEVEQGSAAGVVVEAGTSIRLSETDLDRARWPHVRMLDTRRNQDGCKQAVLVLGLTARAVAR